MNSLDYFVLTLFGLALLAMGMSKSSRTESSYLVADRQTSFLALSATLIMTEFNTATLLAFSSLGYVAGFWGLVLPTIFLIGLLFYAMTVAKKWKSFNGLSVAAFFSQRYGSDLGKLASLTLLTAMAGFSATYVKSLAILFQPLFPHSSEWLLSGLLVGLALIMTLRGGLWSVIYTDTLSCLITLCFFPIMAFYAWNAIEIPIEIPSWQQMFESGNDKVPLWFITSLIILTMFTYILAPWYGQKIFAAKTEQVAYLSVIAAAIVIFCLYGLAILAAIGLKFNQISLSHPEQALAYIVGKALPHGWRGLGYGIFFAASATTLTGVWGAMTAMIIGDFLKPSQENRRMFWIMAGCAWVSYLLSNLLVDQILEKLILANIPVAALSFALLAGFYWKKASRLGAYCSIIVGLLWGCGSYIFWGEEGGYTWYWALMGIPLIFVVGILGSYYSFLARRKLA
jgi:Na+/proline symporter